MPDDSPGESVRRLDKMEVGESESEEIDQSSERRWNHWNQGTNAQRKSFVDVINDVISGKRKSFADVIDDVMSGKQRSKSCPSL